LLGDCPGLALTPLKNTSFFLAVAIETLSKQRIGFSTHSAQSSSSHEEGALKNVN